MLPAATSDNLRSVVGYELDRQTPFKPDQVYYDCRIVRRDASARQIEVDLLLTPRTALDAELAVLDGVADGLDAVDVVDEQGLPTGCNLLPVERRARRGHAFAWLVLGMTVAAAFMLAMAGSQSLDNRREAVAKLQEEVDARRVDARRVNQLRERLDDAVEGANFLAVQRSGSPSVLDLINELTYRMPPDSTYLERLSLSGEKLSISGQSSQAAELVGLLQPSLQIRSASLSGSIQPDSRTGKDRFTISAEYVMPDGGVQRDFGPILVDPGLEVVDDPEKAAAEANADRSNTEDSR
ncbi:MAG: PilN domain-containing protein [Lysobacteraceae bacterium]